MEFSCASGAGESDEANGRDAASNSLKRDLFKSILLGQAAAMHTSRVHGFLLNACIVYSSFPREAGTQRRRRSWVPALRSASAGTITGTIIREAAPIH